MAGTTAAAGQTRAHEQGDQRGRHQNGKQRQDEDIHWQRKDGDAVEVEGHGQGHGQLDDAGDDQQFDDAEAESARQRGKTRQAMRRCSAVCKYRDEHAQGDAKLRQLRSEFGVDGDEAEVARGVR